MKPLHADMKYKIGDLVKIMECSWKDKRHIGQTGRIIDIGRPDEEWNYEVDWNNGKDHCATTKVKLLKVKKPVKKEKVGHKNIKIVGTVVYSTDKKGNMYKNGELIPPKPLKQSKIPKCKMTETQKQQIISRYRDYEELALEILGTPYSFVGEDPIHKVIENLALVDLIKQK